MRDEKIEFVPELLVVLIMNDAHVHRSNGVRIAQGALVHRLARYDRQRAVWEFYCEDAFSGDAHVQHESFDPVTCVTCLTRMPWFRR